MGLKNIAILISLASLSLAGCSNNMRRPVVYTRLMMNTVVEFSLWETNPSAAELAFNEIGRIEDKFSIFRKDSEISKINNGLPIEMSPECKALIKEGQRYSEITHGAFRITYKNDKSYDFGGIAKGYAVDRVAEIFKENGVTRAMVDIGGNLYLVGYPLGKNYWTIGIKDPRQPNRLIARLRLAQGVGVATSGNYERPGHIIDPKTGVPAGGVLSVTIVAEKAITADALSTGVFVLGKDRGIELIETLPGVEGVIIDKDGSVNVSEGLKDRYEGLY